MAAKDETIPCTYCGVAVLKIGARLHLQWHKANNLHKPDCSAVVLKGDAGCTCGVVYIS